MTPAAAPQTVYVNDFTGLGSACLAISVLRATPPHVRFAYMRTPLLEMPSLVAAAGIGDRVLPVEPRWRRFERRDWAAIADFLDASGAGAVVNVRNPDLREDPTYAEFRAWYPRATSLVWSDLYALGPERLASMHARDRLVFALRGVGVAVEGIDDEWAAPATDTPPRTAAVGLFCGASFPSKQWPLARWGELGNALDDVVRELVVVAGATDREREDAHALTAMLRETTGANVTLAVSQGLGDLVDILGSLALLVANDTGVGHLAAACGIPTVSVFLSTDPRVWAPRSSRARHVQGAAGRACPWQRPLQGNCARHYGECHPACANGVEASDVVAVVRAALAPLARPVAS